MVHHTPPTISPPYQTPLSSVDNLTHTHQSLPSTFNPSILFLNRLTFLPPPPSSIPPLPNSSSLTNPFSHFHLHPILLPALPPYHKFLTDTTILNSLDLRTPLFQTQI